MKIEFALAPVSVVNNIDRLSSDDMHESCASPLVYSLHRFLFSFAFQNSVTKSQQENMNLKNQLLQEKVRKKKHSNMLVRLF